MLKKLFGQLSSSKAAAQPPDPRPLLQAIEEIARADNPNSRANVYRQMLSAWFWFCVPELPEGSKAGLFVAQRELQIPIQLGSNAKGEKIFPVFTDPVALANYDPNSPHMALPSKEVFKIALDSDVALLVINPHDPIRKRIRPGGTVTRGELTSLAEGVIPEAGPDEKGQTLQIPAGTQVLVGRSALPLGDAIRDQIKRVGAQFPEVEKIFRYRIVLPQSGKGSDILAILSNVKNEEEFRSIVTTLMSAIQPLLDTGQYMDLTRVTQSNRAVVEEHGEILYERTSPQ